MVALGYAPCPICGASAAVVHENPRLVSCKDPECRSQGGTKDASVSELGMSLRDYFAGQVASGLAAHLSFPIDNIASESYSVADAMIEARRSSQR